MNGSKNELVSQRIRTAHRQLKMWIGKLPKQACSIIFVEDLSNFEPAFGMVNSNEESVHFTKKIWSEICRHLKKYQRGKTSDTIWQFVIIRPKDAGLCKLLCRFAPNGLETCEQFQHLFVVDHCCVDCYAQASIVYHS